jgi:hypothetical protein
MMKMTVARLAAGACLLCRLGLAAPAARAQEAEFAREIRRDTPNNALQTVMLRMRRKYPDPALWGAFVLFGFVL